MARASSRLAEFTILDPELPRRVVAHQIEAIGRELADDAARHTPELQVPDRRWTKGALRDGWKVTRQGLDTVVTNSVSYVRPVEYGAHLKNGAVIPPAAMLGKAVTRAVSRW